MIKCGKQWTNEDQARHAMKRERTKAILEGLEKGKQKVAYVDFTNGKRLKNKHAWNRLIKEIKAA